MAEENAAPAAAENPDFPAFRQMFTSDEKAKYFKGMIYGPPGYGKTYSVKTIPNPAATLIISAESGLLTLRDMKIPVEVWQVDSWKQTNTILATLARKDLNELRAKRKQPPLETVFIDSGTELTKKCQDAILIERKDLMAARGKELNTIYKDQITQEDWGVIKGRIDRMFRTFRDLPFNVICTALQHAVISEESKTKMLAPLMFPQTLSEQIPGYFDEVFHVCQAEDEQKQTIRWWETVSDGTKYAKDRLGIFPKTINPDWGQVFNALKGGKA